MEDFFKIASPSMFSKALKSLQFIVLSLFLISFPDQALAKLSLNGLIPEIERIEAKVDGSISLSILDIETGEQWGYRDRLYVPINSTFKTLLCAKLLLDIEQKKIDKDAKVTVLPQDILSYAPVTKNLVHQEVSLLQLCQITMETSDNSAANLILKAIGGPRNLTRFLQDIGDNTTRIDRYEPELNRHDSGEMRDTTSAHAMAMTLDKLLLGNILFHTSQAQLQEWMKNNRVAGPLFRSVLPKSWKIADRSGAGDGSRSITALVTKPDGTDFIIALYISGSSATIEEHNRAIAHIGKLIFNRL